MARVLFPVAPLGITIPGAPVVDAVPAFPYEPSLIAGAVGDWLFGPDQVSLATISGDATLTAQAATHAWGGNSVTVKAVGEALVTNVLEPEAMTFWVAFRWRNTTGKNSIIVGNISPPLATGGFALANNPAGEVRIATYGANPNSLPVSDHGSVPAGLQDGDWILILVSLNGQRVITRMTGSTVVTAQLANPRVRNTVNRIALGNAFFTGNPTYTPVDVSAAMFGCMDTSVDAERLESLYGILQRRLAHRGIVVR